VEDGKVGKWEVRKLKRMENGRLGKKKNYIA
jgi:hypothetical protein